MTGKTERTAADLLAVLGAVVVAALLVVLVAGVIFAAFFAQ